MNIPVDKAGLTFAQHEANAIISEEAGEVVKECGKIFRHGLVAVDHAVEPPVRYDNSERLMREVADLLLAVQLGIKVGLLPDTEAFNKAMAVYLLTKVVELRKRLHAPELVAALDEACDEMGISPDGEENEL